MIGPLVLAAALAAPVPVYVALGDSTGAGEGARLGGYPERLAAALAAEVRPVRLVNLCVSGARLGDLLRRQLRRGVEASPALVTVGIGINDVLQETGPAGFARDLEVLGEALAASGAGVVIVNVPDLSRSPRAMGGVELERLRERVGAFNAALAALAARRGFALADLHAAGAPAYGAPGTLSDDLFHPSDEGYRRWAEAILPVVRRALSGRGGPGGARLPADGGVR